MAQETKVEVGVDELRHQLDALWEKHLDLLDSYHQAQEQIARHFSSGFFDLAQATFKSTSRVRYGQEYYDDRMQATARFEAYVDDKDIPRLALRVNDTPPPSTNHSNKDSTEKSSEGTSQEEQKHVPAQQPTPPSTPPTESDEKLPEDQRHKDKSTTADDKEKAQKKPRDPLHWYGILVPPSLRSSRKSFDSAIIQGPIIDAVNSAQALRHVSLEIRKLRKDIKKAEKRVV